MKNLIVIYALMTKNKDKAVKMMKMGKKIRGMTQTTHLGKPKKSVE